MGKTKTEGDCSICGTLGPLTFDHVPPEAAFNKARVRVHSGIDAIQPDFAFKGGRIQQQGAGGHTLCRPCNSNTGAWYGRAYVSWARQALQQLDNAKGVLLPTFCYRLRPLQVAKQIVTMFMSSHPVLRQNYPALVKFVLDRHCIGLPPEVSLHACLNLSGLGRKAAGGAIRDLDRDELSVFNEIVFRPFGFVMSFDSPPPSPDFEDITWFAYSHEGPTSEVWLSMPVVWATSHLPGLYE